MSVECSRRCWMWLELMKVASKPAWLRSSASMSIGLTWPCAGKGRKTTWGTTGWSMVELRFGEDTVLNCNGYPRSKNHDPSISYLCPNKIIWRRWQGYTMLWLETWKWIEKIADGWPLFDYSKTITKGDSDEFFLFLLFR
jgi:hypothetical protein